ncbi:MAG TPA: hypothetical protein VGK73_12480 [Polyangiaceae bacterium]
MKRVYIASPFRGASKEETRQNIVYARLCLLDSLERGEAPYASHLLYTQVWSEHRRTDGLSAGDAWRESAEFVALYFDLGISGGMKRAEMKAAHRGTSCGYRRVSVVNGKEAPLTPEAWRDLLATLPLDGFPELQ